MKQYSWDLGSAPVGATIAPATEEVTLFQFTEREVELLQDIIEVHCSMSFSGLDLGKPDRMSLLREIEAIGEKLGMERDGD